MGNLVGVAPQTPVSYQTQDLIATSPDTGYDLCDDAASGVSPSGAASSLSRRATQDEVGMSVQAHEYFVSEVTCLLESLDYMQSALDQSVVERKQLREILNQVLRAREQSSTEFAQLRDQMN